ncbi:hypothetical protein D9M71_788280 [compost metagenome]
MRGVDIGNGKGIDIDLCAGSILTGHAFDRVCEQSSALGNALLLADRLLHRGELNDRRAGQGAQVVGPEHLQQ